LEVHQQQVEEGRSRSSAAARRRQRAPIKRRTHVGGIFPNRAANLHLVGTLLAERDDEWQVAECRYFSVGSMQRIGELGEGRSRRSCCQRSLEREGGDAFSTT
jgi:hypothetical protein